MVAVDKIYQENVSTHKIKPPNHYNKQQQHVVIQHAKKSMKVSVQAETLKHWNDVVKKLTFQDDFISLLIEEQSNITWQSISNSIPKGVLSFSLKASVNGLNTPDNLKRWGKAN